MTQKQNEKSKFTKNELLQFCKIHTKYKLKNGQSLLSVSSVCKNWGGGGEFLTRWAYRMGLEGHDLDEYMNLVRRIGKLAHQMIFDHFNGTETNFYQYSELERDYAENSVLSFYEWAKPYELKPILLEPPLVSNKHLCGGTPDWYGEVNGTREVIDYKSGSGIWPSHRLQISAYKEMLIENDNPVERARILNIPRGADESFAEEIVSNTDSYFQQFLHILDASYVDRARQDTLKQKIKGVK